MRWSVLSSYAVTEVTVTKRQLPINWLFGTKTPFSCVYKKTRKTIFFKGGDLPQHYSFDICAFLHIIVCTDRSCNTISMLAIVITPDTDTYETN